MGCVMNGAREIELAQQFQRQQADQKKEADRRQAERSKIDLERSFNLKSAPKAPDYIGYADGNLFGLSSGCVGPLSTKGPGMMYIGGAGNGGNGIHSGIDGARFMDQTGNHNARVSYFRETGQTAHPTKGHTVSRNDPVAHLNPFEKNKF
jgi:hypothetical protein